MRRLVRELRKIEFRPLYSVVFLVCCAMFVAHQLTQRILHISIPFADSYLDSFLATPILLTLLLVERRAIFRYGREYTLSISEICLVTALVACVGEVLFPALSDEFTADWLDVLAYALGSVLFYVGILRRNHE